MPAVDLSKTLIIYTSDHGQSLLPGHFTHCSDVQADRDSMPAACSTEPRHAEMQMRTLLTMQFSHAILSNGKLNLREYGPMLNVDCIVQRDSEVLAAEAGQDLVMVSIANGLYYGVSDVAREIWGAIERPKKISDLIDHLIATHNVDRSKCEEETLSFLEDLLTEGLLQVKDGPSS
jgi:hypothetical protein